MDYLNSTLRDKTLNALESETFDLVVIGGGITGAGILREASLRGFSVALLEADDFASGTSSKSTKLIHGGLRYLAMGHIHVVREAARERKRVNRLAPHLAEPQWLMVPSSNLLEDLKYRIGITLYEYLGLVSGSDLHFNLSGSALADFEPQLDINQFPRASIYREYLTDDARLVMGNIRAGIEAGGIAANKLPVTGVEKQQGKITHVVARCKESGREVRLKTNGVINAAGPWVEQICAMDGMTMPKSMVLSKGIHIVIPKEKLPLQHMIFTVTKDARPVFAIPRGDTVYIGTTDTRYDEAANIWPQVLPEEVRYLFEPIERYFGVKLSQSDCLTTWAGLRPLISETGKSTKEISRKDEVWVSDSGLITIAGGKLTGYRKMAEETVDAATRLLGFNSSQGSMDVPLPGGNFQMTLDELARDLTQKYPMSDDKAMRLCRLYGTEAADVLGLGARPLTPDGFVFAGEVNWAVQQEGARNLEDVLYRRTRAALYRTGEVSAIIDPMADMMSEQMGWSGERLAEEKRQTRSRLEADVSALS